MPRVKPLGTAQREVEKIKKQNQAFAVVLQTYMIHNGKKQDEVAEKIGCAKSTLANRKKDIGKASLEDVRNMMHQLGATPEQWLQLGGFNAQTR